MQASMRNLGGRKEDPVLPETGHVKPFSLDESCLRRVSVKDLGFLVRCLRYVEIRESLGFRVLGCLASCFVQPLALGSDDSLSQGLVDDSRSRARQLSECPAAFPKLCHGASRSATYGMPVKG